MRGDVPVAIYYLGDDRHVFTECMQADTPDAEHDTKQAALAGAGPTYYPDVLAVGHGERQILQHQLEARAVAHRDPVE
eukprot:scaffold361728_cov52-Prasinocladus_malaysianus.AAC.2